MPKRRLILLEENNNLYIPANIRTRLEFFKGFGVKELVTTILVVAFSLPFIFLIYKLQSTLAAIIIFMIIIATSVITNVKDDNNLCVVEQVKFMIRNAKMQRKYEYKYFDKRREC